MIRGSQPPPAGAAWRSFTFRPPDPVWTPVSEREALRAALKVLDPDMDVWWSPARMRGTDPRRGRWRIVSWSPRQGNWLTVTYVEGPTGEFRSLAPAEPILRDVERRMWCGRQRIQDIDREIDLHNERLCYKARKELLDGVTEWAKDHLERSIGIRQTFAPGYIRRRQVKQSDIVNTSHQRWLREQRGLKFIARPGDSAHAEDLRKRRGVKLL